MDYQVDGKVMRIILAVKALAFRGSLSKLYGG